MIDVVYETHSISEDNMAGRATGWLGGKLAPEGLIAARQLGERRRDDGIDAVLHSDLSRAAETAAVAFEGTDLPLLADWRLRECNYGERNGGPVAEHVAIRREHIDVPYPGGESWRQAIERNLRVLPDLKLRWDGGRVLLIGHVATRWAMQIAFDGAVLDDLVDADFGWREGWEYELA